MMARTAPSSYARASTPRTSPSGAGPATRVPSPGSSPGQGPPAVSPEQRELARLRIRAETAEAELAKARLVIDIQRKASELLGRLLAESDEDERQPR